MKKIISIFMCLILILSTNISVHAQSNSNLFYEILVDDTVCYTCDDSNLPSSGDYYFGITSNGDVWYTSMGRAIPLILNRGLGLALNPSRAVDFITDYITYGIRNNPFSKPVMNGNTRVGWALDDLTGKKLVGSTSTDETATIPSSEVNNVYNYYNEWYVDNGYNLPDYVNLETRSPQFFTNKLDSTSNLNTGTLAFLNSDEFSVLAMTYTSNSLTYRIATRSGSNYTSIPDDKIIFCNSIYNNNTSTNYQNFVNAYGLTSEKNNVPFTSMMLSNVSLDVYSKNTDDISKIVYPPRVTINTDGTYTTGGGGTLIALGGYTNLPCSEIPYITVFKDNTILNQIINKTYAPVSFNTQQWYDYSENNDNSISTSTQEIDNSTTTNETIYNESAESFSEYYEENNYHIDNSITISNTTEIVNNYYGSDNGGDDNGGGSGGGGDDSDGSLLDRLLNAIIDFFKNIGKIIGALLAGLFELLNSILDAIANINNSFAGIKNFLSSIFSWFPAEIVTLMVLGLGLALLASFITWFKK